MLGRVCVESRFLELDGVTAAERRETLPMLAPDSKKLAEELNLSRLMYSVRSTTVLMTLETQSGNRA
jgi:hypothetical protein